MMALACMVFVIIVMFGYAFFCGWIATKCKTIDRTLFILYLGGFVTLGLCCTACAVYFMYSGNNQCGGFIE